MWQISVDSLVILRLSGAIAWGFVWALFIYKARSGIALRQDHTWVTVVIGVGADLLLSFPGDWWTVAAVIALSSFGIIGFAVFYPRQDEPPSGYKIIGYIEDATALCLCTIRELETALAASEDGKTSAALSRTLTSVHKMRALMALARCGEFMKKKRSE